MTAPSAAPRLVLAESDAACRQRLEAVLQQEGYAVLLPPEPSEAAHLDAFLRRTYADLLLIGVPSGGEAAARRTVDRLRWNPATATLPVVALAAEPASLPAPDILLVRKPFDLDDLRAAVRQGLTGRTAGGGRRPPPAPARMSAHGHAAAFGGR